jgi:hypothetical protein
MGETYIGGGVYVRLTRDQLDALRHILRRQQSGHHWQAFAARPSEAERIIDAYRHELPPRLRIRV